MTLPSTASRRGVSATAAVASSMRDQRPPPSGSVTALEHQEQNDYFDVRSGSFSY